MSRAYYNRPVLLAVGLLLAQEIQAKVVLKTGEGIGHVELWTTGARTRKSLAVLDSRFFFSENRPRETTIRFPDIPAGPRLLLAAWRKDVATHYIDGRWIDRKPGDTAVEHTLTLEPALSGAAEITPAEGVARAGVAFIPADVDGRVPAWTERPEGPAFTEPLKDGKAVFKGLKPGRYVFYPAIDHPDRPAPTVMTAVEIKAGVTVQAALGK
jgi:hypothetical protein